MRICKIEIEVVKMTKEEEHSLWENFHKSNRGADYPVYVCGHKLISWDTDDGNNFLFLQDKDGKEFYISVSWEQ